jgi:multimeric flavodoxin WrbA
MPILHLRPTKIRTGKPPEAAERPADSSRRLDTLSNDPPSPPVILCVYGSPRLHGNTDALMDAFVAGAEGAGARAERVYLRNLKISPCREIYACKNEGRCALQDDMQPLYDSLREVDAIALASPVMFYGVSAHAKAFIDRCQALWCLRYLRGEKVSRGRLARRRGVFLTVGGSTGQSIFDGPVLTFRYFLDAVEADPWKALTVREVDEKGDAERHPTALAEASALGAELAAAIWADLEGRACDEPEP